MKQTIKLGAASALNILLTIGFQWVILTMLGPGAATDALFAAMTIPQLFALVISTSLTHVVTPILAGEPLDDQRRDAWTLLALTTIIFATLSFALAVSAAYWTPWIVPGFSTENKALTVELARISVIGIVFTGINAVQAAAAFARHHFIRVDVITALANVTAIALLIGLMPIWGVYAAAWIAIARIGLLSLLLSNVMGAPSRPDFNTQAVQDAWRRLRPLILGASYYKMDPLVDRVLMSALTPGSLSLFYITQQLHGAASQVLVKALGVPAITRLSVNAKSKDFREFFADLRRTSRNMAFISLIGVIFLVLLGRPIISAAMEFGKFGREDSHTLWILLILTSGMLVAGSVGSLVSGAFYAQGDTKTPTLLGSLSFTLAIVLKIVMFWFFGLFGVAVATSLYYMLSLILLMRALSRHGPLGRHGSADE